MVVIPPPVEPNLLRLVDRTHQKPNTNRQQLDFRERNLDVPGDDEALVQYSVKDFDQTGGPAVAFNG